MTFTWWNILILIGFFGAVIAIFIAIFMWMENNP